MKRGLSFEDVRSEPGQSSNADPHYDAPLPYVFPLFLVFLAFSYLQAGDRVALLGAIRFEFVLGAILIVFSVMAIAKRGPSFEWTAVGKWALALLVILLIMTVFSFDPATSRAIYADRVFKFALLGFFIVALVTNPFRLKLFLIVFLLVAAKMGQEGLHGTVTGMMIWENQGIPRLHGSTPNYAHPNSFSGMAVGMLPFVVFIFPLVAWKWRVALLFLAFMLLNIVLRTGSRTGYLGLFGGLIWLVAQSRYRGRATLGVVLLALAVAPFVPQDYVDRFTTIFETVEVGDHTSSGQRKEILIDAWEVFTKRPLGVGVQAFPAVRIQWFGRFQDTHNLYLEVLTNAGIQGFIVFTGFVIAVLVTLRRTQVQVEQSLRDVGWEPGAEPEQAPPDDVRAAHVSDLRWIRAACLAVMGFVIIRLILGLFGHDLYERYWWFAGGSAIALWNLGKQAETKTRTLLSERRKWPGTPRFGTLPQVSIPSLREKRASSGGPGPQGA